MHYAAHGLSNAAIRRLARQELGRSGNAGKTARAACADRFAHAIGLTVLPVLPIAFHATSGAYGFLPLDLMLLAAALLIARARLESATKPGPGSIRRFR